jgi:3',5'-cyclic AMP phosphodiesterase CpdA
MRKLVHLSDIHFGEIDYALVDRVVEEVNRIGPDIVIVSGDLTQRAKGEQFIEARGFLDQLPKPQIVVPGNHDVPLYNLFDRFVNPLKKYCTYITPDLEPFFADEEMAVIGINTARSLTIKDGRINDEQVENIREKMCALDEKMLKVIVTHHPFDVPEGHDEDDIVGRAHKVMPRIAACGADVFLAGHLHRSHTSESVRRYKLETGHSALIVQAGTATSTRGRGEPNSFNLLEFEHPNLSVKRLDCHSAQNGFEVGEVKEYQQGENGWKRLS